MNDAESKATRDRGRHADGPLEIPAAGWRDILWRVYGQIVEDRVLLVAAGVTFYLLLALVPTLSAFVSTYGLVADLKTVAGNIEALASLLPGGAISVLSEQLERLISQSTDSLSLALVASLAITLWSANAGMKSLFEAMNVAYGETEKRSFLKLNAITLGFTVAAIALVGLLITITVAMPVALDFLYLGAAAEWVLRIAGYGLLAALATVGIAVLYRWGPSRRLAKWRWISVGAGMTVVCLLAFSVLFSWYVGNFGSYDATYGSLGALIGFMMWIWISTTILLVGAELNAEIEHQVVPDTTVPPRRPLGKRGATMADTVAADRHGEEWRAPETQPAEAANARRKISVSAMLFAGVAAGAYAVARRGRGGR